MPTAQAGGGVTHQLEATMQPIKRSRAQATHLGGENLLQSVKAPASPAPAAAVPASLCLRPARRRRPPRLTIREAAGE
jgi:hypothetical protein